ncbi:Uncharacterised protein [Campylobacter geochelonis]|uniref:Acyltransferase n=1 Tax=Campylobacter geochelonis TaxID=1780362 RepID=A0A128EHY3_9BACT|nr:Uncharacterised protein [Campylobacter geochelonis]
MNKAYRSELDGLRAVAVLSVIIYHAELMFRGGGITTRWIFRGRYIFCIIWLFDYWYTNR